MADEKKNVAKTDEAKASKVQKADKVKKASGFSPKNIGKAIKKFFKDLKGEVKKITWPGRKMVIKSTGIVLAAILVLGAGIWAIDYAVSGIVTLVNREAEAYTQVEEETEAEDEKSEDKADAEDKDEKAEEESESEKAE